MGASIHHLHPATRTQSPKTRTVLCVLFRWCCPVPLFFGCRCVAGPTPSFHLPLHRGSHPLSVQHQPTCLHFRDFIGGLSYDGIPVVHVFAIFRPNSLFYSPLSPTIWWLYYGLLYIIFKVLSSFCASRRFDTLRNDYLIRLADGVGGTAEKFTWQLSSGADTRILVSMLDALEEDGARSRFFEAIPGFFNSKQVNNIQGHSLEKFRIKFRPVLNGFIDRALSSNLVSEWVKSSQVIICLNATFEVLGPDGVTEILHRILDGRWQVFLQSVEMANSLRRWAVVVTTNLLI